MLKKIVLIEFAISVTLVSILIVYSLFDKSVLPLATFALVQTFYLDWKASTM